MSSNDIISITPFPLHNSLFSSISPVIHHCSVLSSNNSLISLAFRTFSSSPFPSSFHHFLSPFLLFYLLNCSLFFFLYQAVKHRMNVATMDLSSWVNNSSIQLTRCRFLFFPPFPFIFTPLIPVLLLHELHLHRHLLLCIIQ